jgi:hypothetical protein
MIEAGAPSTEEVVAVHGGVPAPPGVVMVSPPTTQRNASRAQSEGRAKRGEQRGQQYRHYKSRDTPARSVLSTP